MIPLTMMACNIGNKLPDQPQLPDYLKDYIVTKIDDKAFSGDYDQGFRLEKKGYSSILWFEKYADGKLDSVVGVNAYHDQELVVKLRTDKKRVSLNELIRAINKSGSHQIQIKDSIISQQAYLLSITATQNSGFKNPKQKLINSDLFEFTEPNYLNFLSQSNQYLVDYDVSQWHLQNTGAVGLNGGKFNADASGIEAMSKMKYSRLPKSQIRVAILDTGIDTEHPALIPALWVNTQEIPGNNKDDDNNGFIDDVNGWNFSGNNNVLTDFNKHGTHVAGIVAANPTEKSKITGIAPEAKLLICKLGDNDAGTIFSSAKSIDYAVKMKAHIINMSYGRDVRSDLEAAAIDAAEYAGLILVAAAGNDNRDVFLKPRYPACYPRVLCIAATGQYDGIYSYSNYQSEYQFQIPIVQLAAPGVEIMSTLPGKNYGRLTGTSMASPYVAGSIALIKSIYPNEGRTDIQNRLVNSADRLNDINDKVIGGKRLNIYQALFQPKEQKDQNGIPYREQIADGQPRGIRYPYANYGDAGVDGKSYETAYKIASMKQLMNIRDEDLYSHFRLMNNISWDELPNVYREMINKKFQGIFYGEGFTIYNFQLKRPSNGGLFSEIGPGGKIISLRFSGAVMTAKKNVGIIAANMNGALLNDVQVEGTVNGENMVGGFCGQASNTMFVNCYFGGEVINNEVSTQGIASGTGGFAGMIINQSSINRSHVQVMIRGKNNGGFAGFLLNSKATNLYANVTIQGTDTLGGLFAAVNRSVVENSYAQGLISTTGKMVGGAAGFITLSEVKNLYSRVLLSGNNNTGGLLGFGRNFSLVNSYYLSGHPQGAGGVMKTLPEMREQATFRPWFASNGEWTMPAGFTPAQSFLPRSVVSLY